MIVAILLLFAIVTIGCLMISKLTINDNPKISKYIQNKYPGFTINRVEYYPRSGDVTVYNPAENSQGRSYNVIGEIDGKETTIKVQVHGLQGVSETNC